MSTRMQELSDEIDEYSAKNYGRVPDIVLSHAEGVKVWDVSGQMYIDMIAGYSALNMGHNHPRIRRALTGAMNRGLVMSPHSFRNEPEAGYYKALCDVSGMAAVLPLNAGVEAFEAAVKLARKFGHTELDIPQNKAEIIVAKNNFHGRTLAAISASSNESHRKNFGPFLRGFRKVLFGDAEAMRSAISERTAAVIIEPIQGEGGINIPPAGYLTEVKKMCKAAGPLFILDEIQTGFGRTGKMFAYMHENVKPDALLVGKSVGGGMYPVSALLLSEKVKDVLQPGDHGSTWGGNPYACTIGLESIRILQEEGLVENSATLGTYLLEQLKSRIGGLSSVTNIRGRGLFVAIEFEAGTVSAKELCMKLLKPVKPTKPNGPKMAGLL
ncbi:ornithine--oxo-acid transaminase, partial [candidate division KSB1 bacterium]|nr:ornithine--oxo-acid transaminase [candidate division KSB1 bacterium]